MATTGGATSSSHRAGGQNNMAVNNMVVDGSWNPNQHWTGGKQHNGFRKNNKRNNYRGNKRKDHNNYHGNSANPVAELRGKLEDIFFPGRAGVEAASAVSSRTNTNPAAEGVFSAEAGTISDDYQSQLGTQLANLFQVITLKPSFFVCKILAEFLAEHVALCSHQLFAGKTLNNGASSASKRSFPHAKQFADMLGEHIFFLQTAKQEDQMQERSTKRTSSKGRAKILNLNIGNRQGTSMAMSVLSNMMSEDIEGQQNAEDDEDFDISVWKDKQQLSAQNASSTSATTSLQNFEFHPAQERKPNPFSTTPTAASASATAFGSHQQAGQVYNYDYQNQAQTNGTPAHFHFPSWEAYYLLFEACNRKPYDQEHVAKTLIDFSYADGWAAYGFAVCCCSFATKNCAIVNGATATTLPDGATKRNFSPPPNKTLQEMRKRLENLNAHINRECIENVAPSNLKLAERLIDHFTKSVDEVFLAARQSIFKFGIKDEADKQRQMLALDSEAAALDRVVRDLKIALVQSQPEPTMDLVRRFDLKEAEIGTLFHKQELNGMRYYLKQLNLKEYWEHVLSFTLLDPRRPFDHRISFHNEVVRLAKQMGNGPNSFVKNLEDSRTEFLHLLQENARRGAAAVTDLGTTFFPGGAGTTSASTNGAALVEQDEHYSSITMADLRVRLNARAAAVAAGKNQNSAPTTFVHEYAKQLDSAQYLTAKEDFQYSLHVKTIEEVDCSIFEEEKIVGFDTEWRPEFRKGGQGAAAILQLAFPKRKECWVVDLCCHRGKLVSGVRTTPTTEGAGGPAAAAGVAVDVRRDFLEKRDRFLDFLFNACHAPRSAEELQSLGDADPTVKLVGFGLKNDLEALQVRLQLDDRLPPKSSLRDGILILPPDAARVAPERGQREQETEAVPADHDPAVFASEMNHLDSRTTTRAKAPAGASESSEVVSGKKSGKRKSSSATTAGSTNPGETRTSGGLRHLSSSTPGALPKSTAFQHGHKFIDILDSIPKDEKGKRGSLADLAKTVYGKPLSKEITMLNWEVRPMEDIWIEYAALDAIVPVEYYLQRLGEAKK
ncbi:unnamed protein product [Amoebophrya sp. A120]|nr:unnamed protein product [Amoebophrya sp. A120]|eukprot:GSA120T00006309001.1